MNKHYIEHWPATNTTANVASDIARHLQLRQSLGLAIVFAERPVILLSAVRKHWLKLSKTLQVERSRTLDFALRTVLTDEIERMETLRFSSKPPHAAAADVFFIEPTQLQTQLPNECMTLYTDNTMTQDARKLTEQLHEGGVIVQYAIQK